MAQTYGQLGQSEIDRNARETAQRQKAVLDFFRSLYSGVTGTVGGIDTAARQAILNQGANLMAFPGVIANTPVGQVPQWGSQPHNVAQNTSIIPQAQAAQPTKPIVKSTKPASFTNYPGQPVNQQGGQTGHTEYTVKPGDTLWGIAQQYLGDGNRWHELGGFNFHTDPRTLQPGTIIHVPNASMVQSQRNIGPAPSNVASNQSIA